jgi:hypothetical protein
VDGAAVPFDRVGQWRGARKPRRGGAPLYLDAGMGAAGITGPRLHQNLPAIVEADSEHLRHRSGIEKQPLGPRPEVDLTPLDKPVRR